MLAAINYVAEMKREDARLRIYDAIGRKVERHVRHGDDGGELRRAIRARLTD